MYKNTFQTFLTIINGVSSLHIVEILFWKNKTEFIYFWICRTDKSKTPCFLIFFEHFWYFCRILIFRKIWQLRTARECWRCPFRNGQFELVRNMYYISQFVILSVTKLIIFIIFHPYVFVTEIAKSENAKMAIKNIVKYGIFNLSVWHNRKSILNFLFF